MTIEEMHSQRFHGAGAIAAQRTRLDQVMLADMFILEMGSHGDLSLKSSIADRTVVRQCFCVRRKVLSQVILPKEPFLTHTALVGLDTCVTHFVSSHIRAVRELHVTDVALKQFAVMLFVGITVGLGRRLLLLLHADVTLWIAVRLAGDAALGRMHQQQGARMRLKLVAALTLDDSGAIIRVVAGVGGADALLITVGVVICCRGLS